MMKDQKLRKEKLMEYHLLLLREKMKKIQVQQLMTLYSVPINILSPHHHGKPNE